MEYGAGSKPFPKPRPFPKNSDIDSLKKVRTIEREKLLDKRWPNKKVGRDMLRPPGTQTIINKNGLYYPNVKWNTYRSFPKDSVLNILGILNCDLHEIINEYRVMDTIFLVDGSIKIDTSLIQSYNYHSAGSMCFAPGFGIVLWSKGEILQLYSICFGCSRTAVGYKDRNKAGYYHYQRCIDLEYLKSELKEMGYLKPKEKKVDDK